MKIEELFNESFPDIPDNCADHSEDFSDELKERIYSRIQFKLASQQEQVSHKSSVSGVEKYKRPILTRCLGASVSAAAAAVIILGSLSVYVSRNNNKHESVLNSMAFSDRYAAAEILTDEFVSAADYLNGNVATNSFGRYFYDYSTHAPNWQGGDVCYYMIDNDRYNTCADVYDAIRDAVSDDYLNTLKDNGGLFIGKSIDEAVYGAENVSAPVLVEYNGMLFTNEENSGTIPETFTDLRISRNGMFDFSASVTDDKVYTFDFSWENGQWKINDVRMD